MQVFSPDTGEIKGDVGDLTRYAIEEHASRLLKDESRDETGLGSREARTWLSRRHRSR